MRSCNVLSLLTVVVLSGLGSIDANAALTGGLQGAVEATATASVQDVALHWVSGVEGQAPGTAWAWSFAVTYAGFDADSAVGTAQTPFVHAHADAPTSYFPYPGHAWGDGSADGSTATIYAPKASATWYAAARTRVGIGARARTAGGSLGVLTQFLISNIALDPVLSPPWETEPIGLGERLEIPAEADIVGSLVFDPDGSNPIVDELFRIHTAIEIDEMGNVTLVVSDPSNQLSESDFERDVGSDGAITYQLTHPVPVSFSFAGIPVTSPAGRVIALDAGTAVALDLSVDVAARSTVPEPSALLALGVGVVGLFGLAFRKRPA